MRRALANLSPPSSATEAAPRDTPSSHRTNELLDQIYHEFCQEQEAGRSPDVEEYCARYPRHRSSLKKLLNAHCFLDNDQNFKTADDGIDWPVAGESILGFTLLEQLGRGKFARVFLAAEPALGNRDVVVKISARGAAEAKTLGRLNHPNIVPVHSVQDDYATGLTVVCMPFLGSATLCNVLDYALETGKPPAGARVIRQAVEENALPGRPGPDLSKIDGAWKRGSYVEGVVQIAAELVEALCFIHGLGIRHSDLKPSNVLMSARGQAMLLDFNLSVDRQLEAEYLGGTVPYMSPEQLRALGKEDKEEWQRIDHRSDLFSLGVILFEMLSGAHPFVADAPDRSAEVYRECLLERQPHGPGSLRAANPRVDKTLAHLVERCLAYNPDDRPQSAVELAAALKRYQSRPRRLGRWLGRHRFKAAAAAALALVATSALAYGVAHRDPPSLRLLKEGRRAYKTGDYQGSIDALLKAMDADPELRKRPDLLFERGRARQRLAALTIAARDEQIDQGQRKVLDSEARRRFRDAWHDYEEALALSPGTEFADKIGLLQACRGYCDNRVGAFANARADYEAALDAGLATPEILNNLGYTYLNMHLLEDAEKSLNQSIRMKPTLQAPYHNRALLWLRRAEKQLNDERAALHAFDWPVIRRQLELPFPSPELGAADIESALKLGPETAVLHYNAAQIHILSATRQSQLLESAINRAERWLVTYTDQSRRSEGCLAALVYNSTRAWVLAAARDQRGLDLALEHLHKALDLGLSPEVITRTVSFRCLSGDPRFQALLRRRPAPPARVGDTRLIDPLGDR